MSAGGTFKPMSFQCEGTSLLQSKLNFGLFIPGYGKHPSPKSTLAVVSFLGNQFLVLLKQNPLDSAKYFYFYLRLW